MPRGMLHSKKSTKKTKTKNTKAKNTNQLVTKAVLYKAIHKNEETKMVCVEQAFSGYNSPISLNTEMNNILPSINNGTTQSDRIGDSIRPIRLVVKGYITYTADTTASASMIISRLLCFQQKGIRDNVNKSGLSTNLLQFGSTNTQFLGSLLDITRNQNTDLFTFYYDKTHTFLKPYGLIGTTTPIASMDKSLVKYFTIVLDQRHLPAVLKYSGSSSTYPSNFLPLLALGYAYAQNNTPDAVTTQLGMSYTSTLYFKDA